jgi:hypothetical protein
VTTTLTPYLKLRVNSALTADAKANLAKIDTLGAAFTTDASSNTLFRSAGDIYLLPDNASVGGFGVGGSVIMGSASQLLERLSLFASAVDLTSPLGLLDQGSGGTKYLRIGYNSTVAGAVDTVADRALLIDVEGANRSLVLGTDLSISPGNLALGLVNYVLPSASATLVDLDDTQTLTNKAMSGATNTFSSIPYGALVLAASITNSDVSSSAAIAYSKLNLSGSLVNNDVSSGAGIVYSKLSLSNSIVNTDISTSAAIEGTKIAPDFGSQPIRTTSEIQIAKTPTIASKFSASPSQASDISYVLPSSAPILNQVLRYNGSSLEWASVGSGTVTSVGLGLSTELDNILDVSSSPITSSGTIGLDLATQAANQILAGPTIGSPDKPIFRALVADDIPTITTSKLSDWATAWDARLATKTTTDLTEGSNLYYTAARFNTAFSGKTTTDLAEGTNLYYTTGRFDAALATKSTSDLVEGSNLYYTTARFNTAFSGKTTTDLAEGTNLYYTDVRADARITLQKGSSNGLATLDAGGKIPSSQLPSSVMEYKGTWNASTNTPTLADGVGDTGDVYLVNVAGTQNLGSGSITFAVGDWVVYNGTIWQKSINSNAVVSVNGYTGVVALTTSDISEGTNLYYLDSRVDTRLSTYKYAATWVPGDGTTKVASHGLGTTDVTWAVYEISSGEEVWPDTVVRNDANTMTFTSSVAPASNWRIVITKA